MPERASQVADSEQVSAGEMYQLRRALLRAERLSLLAQLIQNRARALLLTLEKRYGLLGTDGKLDIDSGRITRETSEMPQKTKTIKRDIHEPE
ncbi:MAG: hypothetical protein HY672_04085 [Chloroflexi bacterium]|nr:hypothetical protein [Chloroflexota bacterium]